MLGFTTAKLDPFLGFYPVQIDALKALWSAIHNACDVPLVTPTNQFGKTSTVYEQAWTYGKERGFVSHYHVNKKKIDCAGLDIKTLLEDLDDSILISWRFVSVSLTVIFYR